MKRLIPHLLPFLLSVIALSALTGVGAHAQCAEKLSYNRDVRPILSDTCFKCHGPDKGNRKGKLRLDDREAALAKEAFVPGKAAESELVKRLHATDPDDVMPPKESARQLTDAQCAVLERWIAEGAVYEPHWAYIVPKKSMPPAVSDHEWNANPIDRFIRTRLDAEKVTPSPEADRATLLRRLSLDLTGLPPTPAEIAAFVADQATNAYEKQIQRLLVSPHYGERMAVPWLDAVRFADTVGFHGDQNENVFPYRDWVINAFNSNMPFDRFTAAQLAGDLLPDADDSTRTASGFNRLNMMTREGGAQPKEYLAKYTADRVRTLGGAWLGSTLACCECHDHKYDPWATKDFYQFASFFADVKQWGVYADYGYTKNPDLAGFNNDYPFPPEIAVESPYLKTRSEKLRIERAQVIAKAATSADAKARAAWREELAKFLKTNPDGWEKVAPPTPAKGAKAGYTVGADGVVQVTAKKDENVVLRLVPADGTVACVRLDLVLGDKGGVLLSGKGGGDVILKVAHRPTGAVKGGNVGVRRSDATAKKPKYLSGAEVIGLQRGWAFTAEQATTAASAVWVLEKPVTIKPGDVLEVTLEKNDLAHLRLSVSPLLPSDLTKPEFSQDLLKRLHKADTNPAVDEAWLMATAADATAYGQAAQLEREIDECRGGRAMTVVSEAWNPLTVRVLSRGNWQDENGEVVQ
ncbi:MAG TPA: DUF1549 domain-containing protein, partial [Planctomycetota bacterium]|nr:DUF1549 domain-containing protein [Planctomycetota bacterium]